jgi:hypothetical protein
MENSHGYRRALFCLCAFGALIALIGAKCEAAFKPNFAPVLISIDDRGKLSLTYDGEFVTQIGTFYLSASPFDSLDPGDDVLIAVDHSLDGDEVESVFRLHDVGKGTADVTLAGGRGVERTGDRKKSRIQVSPGPKQFTLDVDDHDAVRHPPTQSVKTWSEPRPTRPSPTTTPTSTIPPTKTQPSTRPSPTSAPPSPRR